MGLRGDPALNSLFLTIGAAVEKF